MIAASQDPLVSAAKPAITVFPASMARKVIKASLASRASQAAKDKLVHQVSLARLALLAFQAALETQAPKENPAELARLEPLVAKARTATLVCPAGKDKPVPEARSVHKARRVIKVSLEFQDAKDPLATAGLVVLREKQAALDNRVAMASKESKATLVFKALEVFQAFLAPSVPLGALALKAFKANEVFQVSLAPLV